MKITNAYQAQLARLGGNTDVTVQPPVNKYEKLLGDIEAGGGSSGSGGGLVVNIALKQEPEVLESNAKEQTRFVLEQYVTDKTYNEIKAVLAAGGSVVLRWDDGEFAMLRSIYTGENSYWMTDFDNYIFGAATPDEFLSTDYSS